MHQVTKGCSKCEYSGSLNLNLSHVKDFCFDKCRPKNVPSCVIKPTTLTKTTTVDWYAEYYGIIITLQSVQISKKHLIIDFILKKSFFFLINFWKKIFGFFFKII